MNRRQFLQSGATAGGIVPLAGIPLLTTSSGNAAGTPKVTSRLVPSGNIRDYLSAEAKRITEGAVSSWMSAPDIQALRKEKRRQFFEMMGLDGWWTEKREPPPVTVTGVVEREHYRIEKLYYESL